jgi:hypothetical protein
VIPVGRFSLVLRVPLAGRIAHARGCVLFFVIRGRQGGGLLWVDFSLWLNLALQRGMTRSLEAAISLHQTAEP